MTSVNDKVRVQIDLNDRTKTGLVPVRISDTPGLNKLLGKAVLVYEPDDGVVGDAVVTSFLGRFAFLRVNWNSLRDDI